MIGFKKKKVIKPTEMEMKRLTQNAVAGGGKTDEPTFQREKNLRDAEAVRGLSMDVCAFCYDVLLRFSSPVTPAKPV